MLTAFLAYLDANAYVAIVPIRQACSSRHDAPADRDPAQWQIFADGCRHVHRTWHGGVCVHCLAIPVSAALFPAHLRSDFRGVAQGRGTIAVAHSEAVLDDTGLEQKWAVR
jgi:hypothetical protein